MNNLIKRAYLPANLPMYLQEEIRFFSLENVTKAISEKSEAIYPFFQKIAERQITVTEIDSRFNRKLLYAWKKNGLLPFPQEIKKWNRFSFIETCWLKILLEFRELGIGIEKLILLKNRFFDESFTKQFFNNIDSTIENLESSLPKDFPIHSIAELAETEAFFSLMKEIQFSLFTLYLYSIILTRANYSLVITGDGKIENIDLNKILTDSLVEFPEFYQLLSKNTLAAVNVRKIIVELSGSAEFFSSTGIQSHISEQSVEVIKNLFLENQVKEVTIRISEKGEVKVALKSWVDLENFQKEIYKLRKKGQFEDVIIKTRDGSIQYFEKNELFKL